MPRKRRQSYARHGEGSLKQRRDGLWIARLSLGTDADGKRVIWQRAGHDRDRLADELARLVKDRKAGKDVGSRDQTLADFLERWLVARKPSVEPTTHEQYARLVHDHIAPALGHLALGELSAQHVQIWLDDFQGRTYVKGGEVCRYSAAHIRKARAVLRAALELAARWELVDRNVAALTDGPAIPRSEVRPLSVAEATRILAVVRGHPLAALYTVVLAIGLRQSEAMGLRWQDVDLARGSLRTMVALKTIDGKPELRDVKNATSRRAIVLPGFAVAALRERQAIQERERQQAGPRWLGNFRGLVFTSAVGTPLNRHNVYRQWCTILEHAGLDHARFYDLRHTCASLLLAQGADLKQVSELLGHSSIRITADVYAHLYDPQRRATAEAMEKLFGGN